MSDLEAERPGTGASRSHVAGALAIAVSGLTKTFQKKAVSVEVLKGVDLELERGSSVAIMGASGAGKSTLLHVLGGLERPTAGSVVIEGRDVYALPEIKRSELRNRSIGFVFQFHHLLPEFTALENVMMPALIAREPEPAARARAAGLLEEVGVGHRLTHRPGELSGGEQQRVSLARALVMDPAVVLADEPTGNLDVTTGTRIFDLLLDMNRRRGTTLVVVTHNPELATRMERCLRMFDGRFVVAGPEREASA
ncbi:MAG: ABC transporter ATP-binding protein [bacterium]